MFSSEHLNTRTLDFKSKKMDFLQKLSGFNLMKYE